MEPIVSMVAKYSLLPHPCPGVLGRFDLAALIQPHLTFLFVCLFVLLPHPCLKDPPKAHTQPHAPTSFISEH